MELFTTTDVIDRVISTTNNKLTNWYKAAKEDFGVEGAGTAFYEPNSQSLCVEYTENSEQKLFSYYLPYVLENMQFSNHGDEYFFELWASIAE